MIAALALAAALSAAAPAAPAGRRDSPGTGEMARSARRGPPPAEEAEADAGGRSIGDDAPPGLHLVPPLAAPTATGTVRATGLSAEATAAPSAPPRKSPSLALGLTLAVELPTLFIGPSAGHAYAGEWEHFAITGGGRIADLTLLVVLEKFMPGFGIGPLYAILHPEHLGATLAAYPLAYPIDLILVLALVGSGVYDAVDSWFAAARESAGFAPGPATISGPAAAAVPPPVRR